MRSLLAIVFLLASAMQAQTLGVSGHVLDPQGKPVAGASVHLLLSDDDVAQVNSDADGLLRFDGLIPGSYTLRAEAADFVAATRTFAVSLAGAPPAIDLQFLQVSEQHQSIVITAKTLEPGIDLRNSEVFNRTLFSRDD